MCQTKLWKELKVEELKTSPIRTKPSIVNIIARRSDGAIFKFAKEFDCTSGAQIAIQFLKELESYRNCNCTKNITCLNHINQPNIQKEKEK